MDKGSEKNKAGIAVCCFQNRVCPRFDTSPEILIFAPNRTQNGPIERLDVSQLTSERILDMLVDGEVNVVISGGIQKRFQQMLAKRNINVIWGIAGGVNSVVRAYRKGSLHSGIGNINGFRKGVTSSVSYTPVETYGETKGSELEQL